MKAMSLIPEDALTSIGGTVEDLYRLFNTNNWGAALKLKAQEITIRLLYKGELASEVVQEESSDEDQLCRKRMRTRNQPPSPLRVPARPTANTVRYSRFRQGSTQLPKATRWSRDPTMITHHYIALELKEQSEDRLFDAHWVEKIEDTNEVVKIAAKESWVNVMKSPELAYQVNSGFVGEGFSKVAVYVSYFSGGGLLLLIYDGENRHGLKIKNML